MEDKCIYWIRRVCYHRSVTFITAVCIRVSHELVDIHPKDQVTADCLRGLLVPSSPYVYVSH